MHQACRSTKTWMLLERFVLQRSVIPADSGFVSFRHGQRRCTLTLGVLVPGARDEAGMAPFSSGSAVRDDDFPVRIQGPERIGRNVRAGVRIGGRDHPGTA